MSYAASAALQHAVYSALVAYSPLTDLIGLNVFDALPAGSLPPLYVVLGSENVRDASDKTGGGALHSFTVSVVTQTAGFAEAKAVAGAISDALVGVPLTLDRGVLVALNFYKAKAARVGTGAVRQITLTFRARIADDT